MSRGKQQFAELKKITLIGLTHLATDVKNNKRLEQIRLAALQQNVMSKQQETKPQTQPKKEDTYVQHNK